MYKNKRTHLGFIGLGLMGKPMVFRLLLAEYNVFVWNRSQAAVDEVTSAGAVECATPADVAKQADIVILCLANTNVVRGVAEDADFLDALKAQPGKIIIDHSSISPAATRALAATAEIVGASWIDAPVSGGVPGAEQGTLVIMAGGDAGTLDKVEPIMAALSSRVTHMGPSGSGQTTKLCNQIIVGCNIAAISEAIRLAKAAGVDANRLPDALAGGFADSLPFQIFGRRMATATETPVSIKMETMLKDLDGAITAADANEIVLELAINAAASLRARCDSGDAERCITSLAFPPTDSAD